MARYRLEEIAPICQGVVPESNQYWLLNLDAVESNTGRVLEYVYVDYAQIGASTITFDESNVLYSKLRPYLNKVVLPEKPGYATSEMLPLKPDSKVITREYLAYFLRSPSFVEYINGKTSGAKMPRANISDLKAVEIECPSINKQKEVVSAFAKLECIVRKRHEQLSALDDLIKARFVEMFGDPEHNSKSWPVQPLDSLCSVGSSKRIYQNEQSADGVPFWRITDLVSKMDTGVADSGLFIPEKKYLELRQAGLVPVAGDILVTSRGTLGRCYIIQEEDRFYFQDGMISWLSNYAESITPLYLQHLFTMNGFRKQIDGLQAGSTVAYLSIAMLKKLRIMVPSKEVQSEFAAFVAQIDKSKSVIQKSLDETQLLFDSLMQEYFG